MTTFAPHVLEHVCTADLRAFASGDGLLFDTPAYGIAGRGVAAVVDLPLGVRDADALGRVSGVLMALAGDRAAGGVAAGPRPGPVAMAALPFLPGAPAHIVVPQEILVRLAGGTGWCWGALDPENLARRLHAAARSDADGAGNHGDAGMAAGGGAVPAPDAFELRSVQPHTAFRRLVADALDEIARGTLRKVVVARQVAVHANMPIPRAAVLERLHALFPSCAVFAMDGFVGASPELLAARTGRTVIARPLAGTAGRSGDAAADAAAIAALRSSPKNRTEHGLVVDAVRDTLDVLCDTVTLPEEPEVLTLRNVSHLATPITGTLRPRHDRSLPSALDVAAALHPTPAVGGWPSAPALDFISTHEAFARGRYAGPVGWVDSAGDGEWVVGIRSAELDDATATLTAGAGIVEGSDPDVELVETQLKLQAILAAAVRP